MRIALTVAIALSAMVWTGEVAWATAVTASAAYGFSADLTFRGITTILHPVGRVAGRAPPAYNNSRKIKNKDETIRLNPITILAPELQFDAQNLRTEASGGILSASGSARIGSVGISLASYLFPPIPVLAIPIPPLPSFLSLSLTAKNIQSSSSYSELSSVSRNGFVTGDASFGSLSLSGALIGGTLTFSGNAAPNTVIFSIPTVTVTLDQQIVANLISCTALLCRLTPTSITTDAIDIRLDDAMVFGQMMSGNIIIGQSFADPSPIPTAEPGALSLFLIGIAGAVGVRCCAT